MVFPVAASQSMWGKAYKYFAVKPVFLLSILIFEVGSLMCGKSFIRGCIMFDSLNGLKLLHGTATRSLPVEL
jgi:hypothetical protein